MSAAADAPRRSSRRPKPKNYSSYSVGDVVEITRHNVSARGRLAYKLSEGATPNPRWLVTFDGQAWKDEELYERSFGKILEKAEETEVVGNKGPRKVVKTTKTTSNNNNKKSGGSHKNSGPSSGEDDDQSGGSKKKSVAFSEQGSNGGGSEDSSSPPQNGGATTTSDAKVSAREQRSLRRQAKIHEEASGETVYLAAAAGDKRGRFGAALGKGNGNGSLKKARKDEEVLKIPMLTGTLYLYRGLNRRAEFIRRY